MLSYCRLLPRSPTRILLLVLRRHPKGAMTSLEKGNSFFNPLLLLLLACSDIQDGAK